MLVSFQQGVALALHGVGQALLASNYPLEGAEWTYNYTLFSTEALKISQALLALQIALVSLLCRRSLLLSVTLFSTLYYAAVAAFWIKTYPDIDSSTFIGVLFMAIGAVLFGIGFPNQQGPHHLQPTFQKQSQSKPITSPVKAPITPHIDNKMTTQTKTHNKLETHPSESLSETPSTTKSIKVVLPDSQFTTPIILSEAPSAAACAQIALEKHHSSSMPRHPNRVAPAFQRDPYNINLNEVLAQRDDDDLNANQVYSPNYFESGRPLKNKRKGGSSSSSSMEIVEQVEGEPYRLFYNDDDE